MHGKMLILFIDIETTGCCSLCFLLSFETFHTKPDCAPPHARPRFQVCTPTSTTLPSWPSRTPRRLPPHPTHSKSSTCSARATTMATTRTSSSKCVGGSTTPTASSRTMARRLTCPLSRTRPGPSRTSTSGRHACCI